jgi:NAD(P)-dependent dehydrogenase (short-subunit alcohol dehydrogenase family)
MSTSLAIVTGAAHRLGKTFALTLALRGYAILLHYHNAIDEALATAEEIRATGVEAYLVQADLASDEGIISVLSVLDSLPCKPKILVNSASIMQKIDLRVTSSIDWDATFALNLRAPFILAQQVAKRMTEGGLIVNITDVGARKLWTGYPAYVVSKSALETLTRLMAKIYAPSIRVDAIAPGFVIPSDNITEQEWEKQVAKIPLERPVSLDEIARVLAFLLDNPIITGQTIDVDGGYSLI